MSDDVFGSLRKVNIDGVPYSAAAEGGYSGSGSGYENSSITHSSGNARKMVKRSEAKEGITLICGALEVEELKRVADSANDVPLSFENAAGHVYRAEGWIEFEGYESEEGKATIQMMPRNDWTLFAAS